MENVNLIVEENNVSNTVKNNFYQYPFEIVDYCMKNFHIYRFKVNGGVNFKSSCYVCAHDENSAIKMLEKDFKVNIVKSVEITKSRMRRRVFSVNSCKLFFTSPVIFVLSEKFGDDFKVINQLKNNLEETK